MFEPFLFPVSILDDQCPYLMEEVPLVELKLVIVIEQRRPHSHHAILLLRVLLYKLNDLLQLLDLLHGLVVNILLLLDKTTLALFQFPCEGKLPQYEVDVVLEIPDDVVVVLEE